MRDRGAGSVGAPLRDARARGAPLRGALALAAFGATLGLSAQAEAYCRTAACDDRVGTRCEPALVGDCGTPLYWETSCVGFALQEDGSKHVSLADLERIAERSFGAWAATDCGAEPPSVEGVYLGTVACDAASYDPEGPNANLVVFRDDRWPYGAGAALALTTVTYSLSTGAIRDADVELNGVNNRFTISDEGADSDLESVLTHEFGHVLGISHTDVEGATMVRDYVPGSIELRSLEADDRAAICAAYPPDRVSQCAPTPNGGLLGACGELSEASGGCSCEAAGRAAKGSAGGAWWPGAVLLVGLARMRRRATPGRA